MARQPHYFTLSDFFKALLGSLFVGLTFLFKGNSVSYAISLERLNLIIIFLFTCVLVTIEIYSFSYKFVLNKKERPFYEFWAKRFFSILMSSFWSLLFLTYLYGLNDSLTRPEIFKVIIALLLPAATTGAAMEILRKK